jgi:hypothetical protein
VNLPFADAVNWVRGALKDQGFGVLTEVDITATLRARLNEEAHSRPWNPDWATHEVVRAADAAEVKLDIKGGRHYTASQLLAGGFDLRNTAARLGHSGGGATTLRHYADPVPEVDRRAAAYLAKLTARSGAQTGLRSRRRTRRVQHETHP